MRGRIPDRVRYARALRAAGNRGLHTSYIRSSGLSGNPAQRAADLEDRGFRIRVVPEHHDGRNGARHTLIHDAGDAAAYLTESQLASGRGVDNQTAPLRAAQARRPGSGDISTAPGRVARLTLVADYLGEKPRWYWRTARGRKLEAA